ncbi:hypothetical protein ESA94_20440 [Lacibacter luteus]|uniref:Tape measure protein N-terminal domain-containing protein n=1 Tax=Lacibacter luteus TaxID=2508719 RepID=A0A4V1M6Z9_9BACT|nr:tape measure protein [Lacibacter luteus]RXK57570.1 hypothetical protein ESA94_20440 [Lacibacter luteus]
MLPKHSIKFLAVNNSVLEFFVKMKDLASSGLSKVASNAKKMADTVTGANTAAAKTNDKLALSYDGVRRKIKEVEAPIASSTSRSHIRQLRTELDGLNRAARMHGGNLDFNSEVSSGSGIGGWIKKLGLATVAIGLFTTAFSFANNSINKAMEYGSTVKSFEVLTGDAGRGQRLAGDLNKLQQDTILGPSVFQNAQTMMGFGIDQREVIGNLKMLGDVSMGNTEKLNALTLAYSQVRAAGRLTGQDLLQFINAGFNPLNEISKKTGLSIGVLKKKMEEGAISADMITAAFKSATGQGGLYHDMLNKMAETPAGKLAQLQGRWESFQTRLGETLMPLATMAMDFAEPLLQLAEFTLPVINTLVKGTMAPMKYLADQSGEWAKNSRLVHDAMTAIKVTFTVFDLLYNGVVNSFTVLSKFVLEPIMNTFESIYRVAKKLLGFKDELPNTFDAAGGPSEYVKPRDFNAMVNPFLSAMAAKNNVAKTTATDIGKDNPFKALGGGDKKDKKDGSVASGITGGGPRTININGVTFMQKLADKVDINNQGDWNTIEQKFQEMFLRILNSGASVQ